jgi:predicted AAA+ superfamily ATPase
VQPFSRSIKTEITKSSLYYFNDLGFLSFAAGTFGTMEASGDQGFHFQNLVYLLLKEKVAGSPAQISFWRTKDGAEVDFVIDSPVGPIPVEVKCTKMRKGEITRGFRSFIEKYHPGRAYVINLSFTDTVVLGETRVHFMPYHRLLFETLPGP